MGIFAILKKNKLMDLFEIPCDYDGYNLVFKKSCTDPKLYEKFNNLITNNTFDINTLLKYKKLDKNSNEEVFNAFYDEWLTALRENNYVIHLDKNLNINNFIIQVNETLKKIGSTKFINNNLVINLYYDELKKYSINDKEIKEKINYDVLEANVVAQELRKIGYELICFFNGFDNDDKAIIAFDKIDELKIIEKKIKESSKNFENSNNHNKLEKQIYLYDKSDLKRENFTLNEEGYEFDCPNFKLIIGEHIYDDGTIEYAKKICNKYVDNKNNILNHMLNAGLREFYATNFKYSDEFIKERIGKLKITINLKKNEDNPQWKFDYAGIIDFYESKLDEHLISIEFTDELILDDIVQIDG